MPALRVQRARAYFGYLARGVLALLAASLACTQPGKCYVILIQLIVVVTPEISDLQFLPPGVRSQIICFLVLLALWCRQYPCIPDFISYS
jgi:hypothetical protein